MQCMNGEGHACGVALAGRCGHPAPVDRFSKARVSTSFKVSIFLLFAFVAAAAFPDSVNGGWLSPVADNWPFVPLHAALTPDGRVLTYGSRPDGKASGLFNYDVWDPEEGLAGGHTTLANMTLTDIFCSYAVILPTNGNLLITGGDNWNGSAVENTGNDDTNLFAPSDNLLTRGNDMRRPRWYATATPLMNGEIYIQGGKNGEDVAELRDVFGQFHTLTGVQTGNLDWWYPRNFLAPDGRVFGFDVKGSAYYVDPSGEGSMTSAGTIGLTNVATGGPSVMYRPGKILQVAGKNRNVITIDINGSQPVVTPSKDISAKRVWGSLTVLPDGKVVATGGSGLDEQLVNVTNYAEFWDPLTGNWTRGAEGARARLYHSIALLLPDASVLVAGGGASNKAPVNQLHGEIYLSSLSVQLFGWICCTSFHRVGAERRGGGTTVHGRSRYHRHTARHAATSRHGDAQHQLAAAILGIELHQRWPDPSREHANACDRRTAGLLHVVRVERRRRSVQGENRPYQRRRRQRWRRGRSSAVAASECRDHEGQWQP